MSFEEAGFWHGIEAGRSVGPMRAMLLAAGLGTRLRPLTDERPKPAVPVGLGPLAMDAFRTFARASVSRIDANAYHLPSVLEQVLAAVAPEGIPFAVHHEAELLGTGGGIRASVASGPEDEVLVMNGDVRFTPDLEALVARHRESGALATLVVRRHPDPHALGAVEVDAEGFVVRIAGRPESGRAVHAAYVFTGVHLLSPEALAQLPVSGCVVRQAYQPMLARGLPLAVVVDDSPWADLGTIGAYFEANRELAEATDDPRGLVHPEAELHATARVRGSVLGRRAIVRPDVELERVVVWDGAVVVESLRDAIVTPRAVVRLPR